MKMIGLRLCVVIAAFFVARALTRGFVDTGNAAEVDHVRSSQPSKTLEVNGELAKTIARLYPDVRREIQAVHPYFSEITEVARVRLADETTRLVVWIHVIVPGMVDHGWGEVLIFKDSRDLDPIVRTSIRSLSLKDSHDVRVVKGQWLLFGATSPLVSLHDEDSLTQMNKQGLNRSCHVLAKEAIKAALGVYLKDGSAEFLKLAPVSNHRERQVQKLPDRIRDVQIYPSLVGELRSSNFKYSTEWEGTFIVKLLPASEFQKPVILEMGVKGWSEGITSEDVRLFIWDSLIEPPHDRPDAY